LTSAGYPDGDLRKTLGNLVVEFAEITLTDPLDPVYPVKNLGGDVYSPLLTALLAISSSANLTVADLTTLVEVETAKDGTFTNNGYPLDVTRPWTSGKESQLLQAYRTSLGNVDKDLAIQNDDARWISLTVNKSYSDPNRWTYLSVDTAYLTDQSNHLKFKVQPFVDVDAYYPTLLANNKARLDLNGRFNFQFLWYPTPDSLSIRVGGFAKKLQNQNKWSELNTVTNTDLGLDKAYIISTNRDQLIIDWEGNERQVLDRNVIKLELLSNEHSELTVGNSEYKAGATPFTTINTRIRITRSDISDDRGTVGSGLYFINLKTNIKADTDINGAYKAVHITRSYSADWGSDVATSWIQEDKNQLSGNIQNFAFMPATQWVIEQAAYGDANQRLVSIYNREHPNIKIENVQLYKVNGIANAYTIQFGGGSFDVNDTLVIREVKAIKTSAKEIEAAYNDPYLGYYKEKTGGYYQLDYLSGIEMGHFLKVLDSNTNAELYVDIKDGNGVSFELEAYDRDNKADRSFGYSGALTKGDTKKFEALKREPYAIRVKAPHLLFANNKYVRYEGNSTGETSYIVGDYGYYFLLKENNRVKEEGEGKAPEGTPFFALEEAGSTSENNAITDWREGFYRFGIKDGSLVSTRERYDEKRVAAFALRQTQSYLYRRFDGQKYGNLTEQYGDSTNTPIWLQFFKYNNYGVDFLSENSPLNNVTNGFRDDLVNKEISFLGLSNKYDDEANKRILSYTFYVDTAYVRNKTVMPQYMLALNPEFVIGDTVWYQEGSNIWYSKDEAGNWEYGEPATGELKELVIPGLTRGSYLFNAQDSVTNENKDYEGKFSYGAEGSTRFAFVDGIHLADSFYVLPESYKALSTIEISRNVEKYLYTLPDYSRHYLGDNTHYVPRWGVAEDERTGRNVVTVLRDEDGKIVNNGKSMVFQFRLIDEPTDAS
jgi:hypothetical protein